ncbi:RagB/SusD family nutrient uptake outer membrane protein [Rapidithrix thailandica]|uniref:RagB/SusD family nutrient uptake outer membrane protein n=1 Tax=Rapidithrix thailandica TaxID=413964 RepID=A0AAW9S596_9BACT
MKKYSLLLLLSCALLSGCDDFLSQVPDNRTSLDTGEKIAALLVSAYPEGNYITFCEAMSDNVTQNTNSAIKDDRNADAYFWKDVASTAQDSPEYYWKSCYQAIAAANHALEAIEKAGDPTEYQAQKGEALVARAYSHFMLVSLFANMYNPATAAADPGIPYVTEPEKESLKTYERKTVAYVYEMIEKDLEEGIPLINDNAYQSIAFHFNKKAAHAFATRFYLFKQAYEKVIEHANQAFPNDAIKEYIREWNGEYQDLTADELGLHYTSSNEKANLLLCETSSLWARSYGRYQFATDNAKQQEIVGSDNVMGGGYDYKVYLYSSLGTYFVLKFEEHFVVTNTNSNTGLPYTIVPLLSSEEMLFNRAEAYAKLGRYEEALADLNIFASKRMSNYQPQHHDLNENKVRDFYETGDTEEALIAAILDMRRAEFLHEGLRWFDILRYRLPVVHRTNSGEVYELNPGDPRRVLQIPPESITLGGLEPNPR